MRSHILVHRATTKIVANSFAFRSKIGKEGLPRGSTPDLETSAQRLVEKLTHLPRKQGLYFPNGPTFRHHGNVATENQRVRADNGFAESVVATSNTMFPRLWPCDLFRLEAQVT